MDVFAKIVRCANKWKKRRQEKERLDQPKRAPDSDGLVRSNLDDGGAILRDDRHARPRFRIVDEERALLEKRRGGRVVLGTLDNHHPALVRVLRQLEDLHSGDRRSQRSAKHKRKPHDCAPSEKIPD